ncbi:MAG: phosphatidylserine/phosphatidylglycerophosphate/cardiolipin synthase family protein [Candidatus Magasanikbacteria bacterium]
MKNQQYKIYSTTKSAWNAMYRAVSDAKESIYWEMYIFMDDDAGKRFYDKFEEKSKSGVDVKLVVDALGSFWVSKRRIQSMKKAGVELIFFNERKKKYRGLWKMLLSRTHRKILIIDENIGFIGGVNIRQDMQDWPDLLIRLDGKAVHSLLRAFAKNYIISGGSKKKVKHLLTYKFRVARDKEDFEFIYDDGGSKKSKSRKIYTEALFKARERVILFSPYYFPDREFLKALWAAKKRGIRVDLLIPYRTDLRIATYLAYGLFSVLYKHGVSIHMSKNMMHGKGVIVDDDWAMVGSSNIDQISFYDNYEANVRVRNKKFVRNLKFTVLGWIKKAEKFNLKHHQKRGKISKMKEWFALRLARIWSRR